MEQRPVSRPPQSAKRSFFWGFVGLVELATAIGFFFKPEAIFYLLNFPPQLTTRAEAVPLPSEAFTVVFTASYFLLSSLFFFLLCLNPRDRRLMFILFACKSLTAFAFVYLFQNTHQYFAYLAGTLVESITALLLIASWVKHTAKRK